LGSYCTDATALFIALLLSMLLILPKAASLMFLIFLIASLALYMPSIVYPAPERQAQWLIRPSTHDIVPEK
jgi:hypothetical protein